MRDGSMYVVKQQTQGSLGAPGWKFIHRTNNSVEHEVFVTELQKQGWKEG